MIHKRLISTVSHTRKYIAANVAVQWVSLWANIMLIQIVTWFLGELFYGKAEKKTFLIVACLLYTSPSPRDGLLSRMPSSA